MQLYGNIFKSLKLSLMKRGFLPYVTKLIKFEDIALSEISQRQKKKYCMIFSR